MASPVHVFINTGGGRFEHFLLMYEVIKNNNSMAVIQGTKIVNVLCHLNVKYYTITVFIGYCKCEGQFGTGHEGSEGE
jgi:hypothetical protein